MKKIAAADQKKLERATEALRKERTALEEYLETVKTEINKRLEKMEEHRSRIHDSLDDLHREAEEYYDNRSDAWKESERGDAYQTFVSGIETARDECDVSFSEPDEIEIDLSDVTSVIDAIEALSFAPSE